MEFQVGYLALFFLISVMPALGGSGWEVFTVNPVNAGVPQGSTLGLTLFCYILMTFVMMLSVILLSMLR